MGLMTDALHGTIAVMATLMIKVAAGERTPQYMGRWVYTFYPQHCQGLPDAMKRELTEEELSTGKEAVVPKEGVLAEVAEDLIKAGAG